MTNRPQDPSPASQQQWQHFGALLRDRRNAAKLSRVALAQKAKVSDSTIKFTETARHPPSRATLIRLLSVAELHLSWAQVPGQHDPPTATQDIPTPPPQSLPPPPPAAAEPSPDPAQFLMDLIGFDEIRLPQGVPKTLRIFQQRHSVSEPAGDQTPKGGREGE